MGVKTLLSSIIEIGTILFHQTICICSLSRNAIKQMIHLFDIISMQNSKFKVADFDHQNTTGIYLSTKASH